MKSRTPTDDGRKPGHAGVVVICPTSSGGHIEHAADLSIALSRHREVGHVTLLTRPGAVTYLGQPCASGLEVREVLPATRSQADSPGNHALTTFLKGRDWAREYWQIGAFLRRQTPPLIVVFELARYPGVHTLGMKRPAWTALVLHNVRPHALQENAPWRDKFLLSLQRRCLKDMDRVLVHGLPQRSLAESMGVRHVRHAQLPRTSFLDLRREGGAVPHEKIHALCLGEIRENKGVDLAIRAAGLVRAELHVEGKFESEALKARLSDLVGDMPNVYLRDRFLTREEFITALAAAKVIVLPYTHFDAQSGVLARAMRMGKHILSSDLPSLRDQAANYPLIDFADPQDTNAFAQRLDAMLKSTPGPPPATPLLHPFEEGDGGWEAVVSELLDGWRSR